MDTDTVGLLMLVIARGNYETEDKRQSRKTIRN